jgi:hypothetical protein
MTRALARSDALPPVTSSLLVNPRSDRRVRVGASAAAALVTFTASGLLVAALTQGSYVLCTNVDTAPSAPIAYHDCAAVDVVTGQTTTVNAKLEFGPTLFTVFDPGASASRGAF